MKVELMSDWFGPDGNLYRRIDNPVEIDDDYRKLLPPSAKVLGAKEAKHVEADAKAAADAQALLVNQGNVSDKAALEKVRADMGTKIAELERELKKAEDQRKVAEDRVEQMEKEAKDNAAKTGGASNPPPAAPEAAPKAEPSADNKAAHPTGTPVKKTDEDAEKPASKTIKPNL
jgi:TolA-binding protein